MTVQKDVTKNIYVGNGSTRTFPFTFECPAEHPEYIKVYLMQDDGTALATSDYQLDMDAKQITYPSSGIALPEGKKLVIMRELPLQQMMNLVNNGPYFAEDIETAFDECVMAMQQIAEKLNRSIIMSVDIDGDAFVNEVPFEAGKSFRIADDGKSIVLTEDPGKVLPLVQGVYAQTQAQAQSASVSARLAEDYKNAAETAKNDASLYATNAKNSAGEAKTYMDNAKRYSENVNVFTPSVSSDGVLSWTNKAGLPNPASVNIKGAKGDQGLQGATGAAATIKIGRVTTGAAGSAASVTNSGTASNVVLNFTLPRGNDGKDGGITVDAELSNTSTNPIQNKTVKTAIDTVTASIPKKVSALENDAGYAKTSIENIWTPFQTFHNIGIKFEKYGFSTVTGESDMPTTSTAIYTITSSNFTLDLTALFAPLMPGESTVFTAILTSNADCALSIINAGNIAYVGSASDIGISSTGTLLNIYMFITENNDMYSVVQANKVEGGA